MTAAIPASPPRVIYPDTDGEPIAENTLQFQWIVTIKCGLDRLFARDENVFVAGDLFWYPVEGHPEIVMAPDAMVAFGRPKGHRMSYLQWEEGGIPPEVVFEVLSPSNRRFGVMMRKFEFYRRFGVEEYYLYDPDPRWLELSGFLRRGDDLVEVPSMNGHVSPRLKVRFEMSDEGLRIVRPDGQPFLTYDELDERAEQALKREEQALKREEQALGEVERLRQRLRALGQEPGG